MDHFYNTTKTAADIEELIKGSSPHLYQLSRFEDEDGMERGCMLTSIDRPACWRLTRLDPDGVTEESVLRVQGVICTKFLPPINHPFVIKPQNQLYLKQSVSITGFGGESFQKGVDAVKEIHRLFSRNFPQNTLEPWTPGSFSGMPTIDMANRFFTHRSQTTFDEILPFNSAVDPDGVLSCGVNEKCVHTIENEVSYFERMLTGDHGAQYSVINPVKFRVGDVVEAQVSFATVPLKGNKHKMLVILRALTLIDDSPLREAAISREKEKSRALAKALVMVKRKVGYENDNVTVAEERMTRMRVDSVDSE